MIFILEIMLQTLEQIMNVPRLKHEYKALQKSSEETIF